MNMENETQFKEQREDISISSKDSSSKMNQNELLELSENTTGGDIQPAADLEEGHSLSLSYEEEENSNHEEPNKEELLEFEKNFNKYYVDSSQNSTTNFGGYMESGLKLISLFPKHLNVKEQIQKIKEKIKLPPQSKKQTLILDLDETLIHSDLDHYFKTHDTVLKFQYEDEENNGRMIEEDIPLILRPNLKDFLDFASSYFELFVFTASYKSYADAILDYIEKDKKYFKLRLYREHCIVIHNCLYIKDLSIFEGQRDLKNIILVDNSIFSFANQLRNGILVPSFYNDKEDAFLGNLMYYFGTTIIYSDDVRMVNEETFGFQKHLEEVKKALN